MSHSAASVCARSELPASLTRAPTATRHRSIGQRTQVVQYASYALWGGSAGVTLFAFPFVYFFYEEEELYGFEVRVRRHWHQRQRLTRKLSHTDCLL